MKIEIKKPQADFVMPSAEECRGWISQSVGKYYKNILFEKLEDLKESWVNGDFTGETTEETVQMNSEALGKAQAFADVLLTLNEICEEEEDEI